MRKKLALGGFAAAAVLMIGTWSCTKEVAKLQGPTDAQMFSWAQQASGRFYYQNDTTTIITPAPAQGNFHGPFKEWFNAPAKNSLGGDGKLAQGDVFRDSALIVKELHTGSTVTGYAVMFKLNQAWSWGWYNVNGAVNQSVSADASLCLSCHNGAGNRDQVLTFTYH
jgi:hypothetical protein